MHKKDKEPWSLDDVDYFSTVKERDYENIKDIS
jgi:hypothetical protein